MSEFQILRNRDLRYLYSGRLGLRPKLTKRTYILNMPSSDIKKSLLDNIRHERYFDKFYIHYAPAFRTYPKEEVDYVVDRLHSGGRKPDPTETPRSARKPDPTETPRSARCVRSSELSGSKEKPLLPRRRKNKTPIDVDEVTTRLLTTPTRMSLMKQREPPPKFRPTFTRSLTCNF